LIGAAATAAALAGVSLIAAAPASETTREEIMLLRAELTPMKRFHFDSMLRSYAEGLPNLLDGSSNETHEEWLAKFEPWEIALIEEADARQRGRS
jgi:hypothetical protein